MRKRTTSNTERQPAVFLHSISQLVTMSGEDHPRRGAAMRDIGLINDGAVLVSGGQIVAVDTTRKLMRDPWMKQHRGEVIELDCRGKVVIPGFVDAHTHPVFVAPRLVDFEKRTAGATYEEIAEAGGGIRSSIADVRKASEARLAELALAAFREMAVQGTTTIEAKSGYGLDLASEIKSL
jgi:imidazolonepropionase